MSDTTSVGYSKEEWLSMYNESKHKWEWFVVRFFGWDMIKNIDQVVECGELEQAIIHLNNIWFLLPDGQFNIMVNPPGWPEFLRLIEPL